MTAYADTEPAVADERLGPIETAVRKRYRPWLDESEFATARVLNGLGVWEVHFLITNLDPRPLQARYGRDITALARCLARDWDEAEKERTHFAGQQDLAYKFFMALGMKQTEALKNAHDQIVDGDRALIRELDTMKHQLMN